MSVEHVDFGKGQRDAARKLAGLLGLVEARDREMLENPKKYFDLAGDEIVRLQLLIKSAQNALREPIPTEEPDCSRPQAVERWLVDKAELGRLRASAAIIDAAR